MPKLREVVGAHLGHLEQRRHQAVGDAAVVHAFADGVDARVVGLHGVVDDDAAVAVQAGRFGQRRCWGGCRPPSRPVRAGTSSAVVEAHRLARGRLRRRRFPWCLLLEQEFQAAVFQRLLQQLAGDVGSSWRSISQVGRCTTVTSMPRSFRPLAASRPEQAAADDDRVLVHLRPRRSSHWCRRCRGRRSRLSGPCRAPAG